MTQANQDETRRKNNPNVQSEPRKSEQTRRVILDTALEYLWSHPFRELTISELMAQTKVARATFYRYFADLHDLMENLLNDLKQEILGVAQPWLFAEENPAEQLTKALSGLVKVCYKRGPIIRAVVEAAPMDERLETAWNQFVGVFDDAVTERIESDQAKGLVGKFEARPIAIALNRMDVGTFVHHFGRRPRSNPDPVFQSIARIWINTIYGQQALEHLKKL